MSERYCPECKQDVDFFCGCGCGYSFGIPVDPVDVEELVKALELTAVALRNSPIYGTLNPMGKASAYADHIAAKFRAKYLEK